MFAWDRRGQQPIILSGGGAPSSHLVAESEVWEVQYDPFRRSSNFSKNFSNDSSTRVLPVMICSEDGILAVVEEGTNFLLHL